MMKITLVLLVSVLFLSNTGQAEIYVITHQDNPLNSLNAEQLRDLYLSRTVELNVDKSITVYDRSVENLREKFIQEAIGMNVRQYDAYWARLIFAGRVLPLNDVGEDYELLRELKKEKYAVSYSDKKPLSKEFKTLLVINN